MARIRTIKPEFPQSESVGRLSRDARLLFIQLWTIVDDAGRARAASRMLASLLYPYDDDAHKKMDVWLAELESGQMIRRYDVDGSRYLEICKWLEHQKIDRPSESRLPAYREHSLHPREDSRAFDADLVPSTMDLVSRTDAAAPKPKPEKVSRAKPKVPIPDGYTFSLEVRAYALEKWNFTASEIDRELPKFIRHAKTNDRRCADWHSAAENWFDKAAEFAGKPSVSLEPPVDAGFYAKAGSEERDSWDAYGKRKTGKTFPNDKNGGWWFPTQWPPGCEPTQRTRDAPSITMQTI